jgi:hypothetical protein
MLILKENRNFLLDMDYLKEKHIVLITALACKQAHHGSILSSFGQ